MAVQQFPPPVAATLRKRIARFTGSGTWTVPAGVTYAIAHMRGGGGGVGRNNSGGIGGASSVQFASGTVSASGGQRVAFPVARTPNGLAARPNSGSSPSWYDTSSDVAGGNGADGTLITAGAAVTPAASITVTVGGGGGVGQGGAAGGSGYVYIEYYEEV